MNKSTKQAVLIVIGMGCILTTLKYLNMRESNYPKCDDYKGYSSNHIRHSFNHKTQSLAIQCKPLNKDNKIIKYKFTHKHGNKEKK